MPDTCRQKIGSVRCTRSVCTDIPDAQQCAQCIASAAMREAIRSQQDYVTESATSAMRNLSMVAESILRRWSKNQSARNWRLL